MLKRCIIKRISILIAVVLFFSAAFLINPIQTQAAVTSYYVEAIDGNDSNPGTSTSQAWKTLAKVNGFTFQPGDRIYF